jgi:heat shock protein HtpX
VPSDPFYRRQRSNRHQTLLIAASLLGLVWLIGWLFAGAYGILWAMVVGVGPLLISVRILPALTLRFYGARRLVYANAPPLFNMVADLSVAAGLERVPVIHYIGSSVPLAFSTGSGADAAIALSDGLLRLLTFRELRGVIGHELSHIANRDTWVMSFADVTSRLTRVLSLFGQLLIIINLPLVFLSDHPLPWLPLLVMACAPTLSALLQLALSRSREYEADLDCIRLTDDPAGLASALIKLERLRQRPLQQLFRPGHGDPEPSLLRTHPATEERINRLQQYASDLQNHRQANGDEGVALPGLSPVNRKPRRHLTGLWH